jgi:hypothetical protein
VLLADEADGFVDPSHEPFHILRLPELDIPHLERFRFRSTATAISRQGSGHTRTELSTTAHPYQISPERC